ncbi:hypothetical protein [Pectobacterium phage Wc4-1]|uniref:HNH nuclease domain-containing protein n=1 Tax=Pectobacterium phage Wc4 TaxID=2652428 RepID=A0A5P8D5W5_9CAUD|nr:hypothetical protein [Pectobacterium phage Wc4]QFP93947.1 hypothetical protein [Pectobacterium phage Wc4-1]
MLSEGELFAKLSLETRYEKHKGKVYWLTKAKGHNVGDEVGRKQTNGYVSFCFRYKTILIHRFIYWLETGDTPDVVDHIDTIRHNNIFKNLRAATKKQNNQNSNQPRGITGLRGVTFNPVTGRYRARISAPDGRKISLGSFADKYEAKAVRDEKAKELFGEFFNGARIN